MHVSNEIRRVIFTLLPLILLYILVYHILIPASAEEYSGINMEEYSLYYDKVDPITIIGERISLKNYSGTGSIEDPVMISKVWVNDSTVPGILIMDTDIHVVIDDSFIFGGGYYNASGIEIHRSANITVRNCRIESCGYGVLVNDSTETSLMDIRTFSNDLNILIRDSEVVAVENCTISGSLMDALRIESSRGIRINDSLFRLNCGRIDNDGSIFIQSSSDIIIGHCQIVATGGNGIIISDEGEQGRNMNISILSTEINCCATGIAGKAVDHLLLSDVTLKWNREGMRLSVCDFIEITGSSSRWNDVGIELSTIDHSSVSGCDLGNNDRALILEDVQDSNFINNTFLDNGDGNLEIIDRNSIRNRIEMNNFSSTKRSGMGVWDNGSENHWSDNIWVLTEQLSRNFTGVFKIPGQSGSVDEDPMIIFPEIDRGRGNDSQGTQNIVLIILGITGSIVILYLMFRINGYSKDSLGYEG